MMVGWGIACLVCAVCFLAAAMYVLIFMHIRRKNIISLLLYFCSVLFINYASLCVGIDTPSGLNRVFIGIINALQSFSLDANYTDIVNNLQGGMTDNALFLALVLLVLVFAPILGGAVLLVVIADLFPDVKYWICSRIARNIYLFSFLNEQSLNMAKELMQERKRGEVCVVFANAWVEEGNEDESNLVSQAVEQGAICLKKDLSVLKLPAGKEAKCFFARDDELRNLDEAIRMAGEARETWAHCRKVSLYVFAQNDTAYRAMEQIHSQMEERDRNRLSVVVIPYRTNTVCRLLYEEPLFEYLSPDPAEQESLHVVIVGSDSWAEELFRTVYWCAQLPEKQLRITSLTEDTAGFERRIRFLIPELDSVDNDRPYCICRFLSCRANTSELDELLWSDDGHPEERLCDARIWFVCMGESRKNLEIAAHLRSRLNALHLLSPQPTVIHYQMDNDHLKETLNQADRDQKGYRMNAFASVLEQYSLRNIHSELHDYARALDDAWKEESGVRSSQNEYNRRSSFASAVHLPYRLYAFGLLPASYASTTEAVRMGLQAYRNQADALQNYAYAIGWLEHRRWNAYTRALGYRKVSIEDWQAYYSTEEGKNRKKEEGRIDTKDHQRKLHTCLTEYRPEPVIPELFLKNLGAGWQELPLVDRLMREGKLDELDALSLILYRMGAGLEKRSDDIKIWDSKPMEEAAKQKF